MINFPWEAKKQVSVDPDGQPAGAPIPSAEGDAATVSAPTTPIEGGVPTVPVEPAAQTPPPLGADVSAQGGAPSEAIPSAENGAPEDLFSKTDDNTPVTLPGESDAEPVSEPTNIPITPEVPTEAPVTIPATPAPLGSVPPITGPTPEGATETVEEPVAEIAPEEVLADDRSAASAAPRLEDDLGEANTPPAGSAESLAPATTGVDQFAGPAATVGSTPNLNLTNPIESATQGQEGDVDNAAPAVTEPAGNVYTAPDNNASSFAVAGDAEQAPISPTVAPVFPPDEATKKSESEEEQPTTGQTPPPVIPSA
jgi:hypothetical protein